MFSLPMRQMLVYLHQKWPIGYWSKHRCPSKKNATKSIVCSLHGIVILDYMHRSRSKCCLHGLTTLVILKFIIKHDSETYLQLSLIKIKRDHFWNGKNQFKTFFPLSDLCRGLARESQNFVEMKNAESTFCDAIKKVYTGPKLSSGVFLTEEGRGW